MREVKRMAAQGDVLFRRVTALPSGCQAVVATGPLVVAHSETGHHHAIDSPGVTMYLTDDPFVCYLRLEGPHADVEHLRSYDTHETLRLLGEEGAQVVFEVRRQREYVPDAQGRRAVRGVMD